MIKLRNMKHTTKLKIQAKGIKELTAKAKRAQSMMEQLRKILEEMNNSEITLTVVPERKK